MPQDGQDASTPYTPTRLQVTLLVYDNNGERDPVKDRHAVTRFPQSYEEVVAAIERNLGEYLPGGKADSIDIFCQMLNSHDGVDEWIWARADRAEWDIVRAELALTRKPLGIRLRNDVQSDEAPKPHFIKGPVMLAYGEMIGGVKIWNCTNSQIVNFKLFQQAVSIPVPVPRIITRPASYQEAVDFIVAAVKDNLCVWPATCQLLASLPLNNFEFKFCYFTSDQTKGPNTTLWVEFPAGAYRNDEIWRATVPEPHKMLGFTLDQK